MLTGTQLSRKVSTEEDGLGQLVEFGVFEVEAVNDNGDCLIEVADLSQKHRDDVPVPFIFLLGQILQGIDHSKNMVRDVEMAVVHLGM